jgi:hypothetical protein
VQLWVPFLCLVAKKWRKKTDFGKPKSQVCLLAVANKQTLPRQRLPPLETASSRRSREYLWSNTRPSPYKVRRILSGYSPVSSLKVLGGVGDFFQEVSHTTRPFI